MAGRKKSDTKRDDILQAAVAEFAHRDFHEVLMDDVAARAGVGKGTLYRYFPTKEELFVSAVLRELSESHADLSAFAKDAPLETALEQTVARMIGYFHGKEELLTLLQRHEHRLPESEAATMRQRRTEVLDAIAAALGRGVRSGGLRRVDTRFAAEILFGMVRSGILYRRDHGGEIERTSREIVSLFLEGVRARGPASSRAPLHAVRRARG